MLPQLHYIYSSILEIGQDIGRAFPSESCWTLAPSRCGALAPSAGLRRPRGTAGPGSSWLPWRPPWSTGYPAPTPTPGAAPPTGSLRERTPPLSLRLQEERRRNGRGRDKAKNVSVLMSKHDDDNTPSEAAKGQVWGVFRESLIPCKQSDIVTLIVKFNTRYSWTLHYPGPSTG